MRIALARLVRQVELQRHQQQQIVLRARERDVQQAPLLLDQLALAGGELGREAAVDYVEHEHGVPLHALGRVDGREHQEVLIERGTPREVAGGVRRIERELGQEALARGELRREQLQLFQVTEAGVELIVQALEVRAIPVARHRQLPHPGALGLGKRLQQHDEALPLHLQGLRGLEVLQRFE